MEELGLRRAELGNMVPDGKGRVRLEFMSPPNCCQSPAAHW